MTSGATNIGRFPRALLAFAALLLVAGGVLHALAFGGAQKALHSSPMPPFYSGSFKALWLIDSATLVSLGVLLVLCVSRPAIVSGWVLLFLGSIPMATAMLIYTFVGAFFPAHMFVVAAVSMMIAGATWRPKASTPAS